MKRTHLLLALIIVSLALGLVPASAPQTAVQAQAGAQAGPWVYLPLVLYEQNWQLEEFQTDPQWKTALLKDPKDGYFMQSPETESYWSIMVDNSALMVAWPGWRASGDYKIEVDARHASPLRKSFNGLGIVFNATEDWSHFYSLMLAAGAAQHFWSVVEFENTRATYLTNNGYRGGTNFMAAWDNWNNLEIRVVNGRIYAFCNDKKLPSGDADGPRLADGLLIGVVTTTYEFSNGEVEFDNFKFTPLYPGDPDYEEAIAWGESGALIDSAPFDTLPMDLH